MVFLGTRDLTLNVDGESHTAEVSNCRIVIAAAGEGFVSFADAKAGGKKQFRLQGTAAQDMSTGSLWDKVRTGRGTTVAAVLAPNGGTVASPTQQKVNGNVVLELSDGDWLGGEADSNPEARFTWEFDLPYTAEPTVVSA